MYKAACDLLVLCLLLICSPMNAAVLHLLVTVPETTPGDAMVCLTGNHDLLGNWDGKGMQLTRTGPRQYELHAEFPAGSELAGKFTRGDFTSVEKDAQGREIPDRHLRIGVATASLTVAAWADQIAGKPVEPVVTGDHRVLRAVASRYLDKVRDVIVWLPPSYAKGQQRYPVLYMHDGRNLFDAATAFGGTEWGVDEVMADGLAAGKWSETIVVGIDNTVDRMSEYTPFPDPKHKGGNGDNYLRFVVEELKPMIDREFHTISDRSHTIIGGSSLGGLISLHAVTAYPEVFGGVIAMSPSVWWGGGAIIERLIAAGIESYTGHIWVDMGTREGAEAIEFSRKLASELAARAPAFKGLRYREFIGATHSEKSWRQRLHLPLQYILRYR